MTGSPAVPPPDPAGAPRADSDAPAAAPRPDRASRPHAAGEAPATPRAAGDTPATPQPEPPGSPPAGAGATPSRQDRRLIPAAAVGLFVLVGIVLLLVPELIAKSAAGEPADLSDILGDLAFLAFGAAAVWLLTSRIRAAFGREAAARQAVEARERILTDALDAVPAAVLLLGETEELAVEHANPAAVRLLDLPASGRPRPLGDILPVEIATLEAIAAARDAQAPWSQDLVLATDAGRRVPLTLAMTPIASAGRVRAVLVAQDRTELRFAERESERLSVELEGFVQTAPVGFVTVGPDGLVAGWNAAAERILGWTAAEMVGSRLPAALGSVIAEALAAGAGQPPLPHRGPTADTPEIQLPRSSGETVTVRLTATTAYGRGHDFFGFTAMFEDVTEAHRIAAERDEAEARFRAAVDASPVPLFLLDPEGKVRLWSAAAERLFGWTAQEAIGSVFPPVPDEGLEQFFANLGRVMAGEAVVAERRWYVGRDGRAIPTRLWTAPVRASDGSLVGVMGACREEPDGGAEGATMEPDIPIAQSPGGSPA